MTITIDTDKDYDLDSFVSPNNVLYKYNEGELGVRNQIALKRTPAKPSANFAGIARSVIHATRTVATGDGTSADAHVEVRYSLPVGMAKADFTQLNADVGELVANLGEAVAWKQDITH